MARSRTHKSGGARKYGRNEEKCKRYRLTKTRERNKLKRVLRSNGRVAGIAYAKKHGIRLPVGLGA